MLGWEYPPHISGGLGTACEGLTRGLARQGVEVLFMVPRVFGDEDSSHMTLIDPLRHSVKRRKGAGPSSDSQSRVTIEQLFSEAELQEIFIPAFLQPYWSEKEYSRQLQLLRESSTIESLPLELSSHRFLSSSALQYGSDIFEEVNRYAAVVSRTARYLDFDLVHAHDWMTFLAGTLVSRQSGKPLVVHIHSLEYDRSGQAGNRRIHDLEKLGIVSADAVIAVSHYTKGIIRREHGIPAEKISVVHNGIYPSEAVQHYRDSSPDRRKRVLFLGRVTFQKGPDYFVEAAAKVIPHVPEVEFVLAGTGDMLPRLKSRVYELGIERHFSFPGFLKGEEVERAFSTADLYVMPSVSEPFGIAALEAISFDTPALISRQTGVSEVLGHTLKFDFWDIDRLADLIINALQYDELRQDMIQMARRELKRLRWDAAAEKTLAVYEMIIHRNERRI